MCVVRAPEVFGQNEDDGLVQVLEAIPPASVHEKVRDAAAACPVRAIAIIEGD
jgi:ferredoxin